MNPSSPSPASPQSKQAVAASPVLQASPRALGSPGSPRAYATGTASSRPGIARTPTFGSLRKNSFRVSDTADYRALAGLRQTSSGGLMPQPEEDAVSETMSLLSSSATATDWTAPGLGPQTNNWAESGESGPRPPWRRQRSQIWADYAHKTVQFLNSVEAQQIAKCSLAYFLASLVVYTPLRNCYGVGENKHMAATVAVYFHPARTVGSMLESMFFVCLSLAYSGFMAFSSMLVSRLFSQLDLRVVGYAIDLFVFCAFGLGTIAYVKQRVNKPTFNTACTVAAIFLITILVKEGSVQAGVIQFSRVLLTFKLVCTGVLISAVVCMLFWPQSAVVAVKKQLNKSMDLNSELLILLTEKFMNLQSLDTSEYSALKAKCTDCFKSLHKQMADARYELYVQGKETELEILEELAQSSYTMLQLLNGLGSSVFTQWSLIESDYEQPVNVNDIYALDYSGMAATDQTTPSIALLREFIKTLGPPMQDYYNTIKLILAEIPFEDINLTVSLQPRYMTSVVAATEKYSIAREKALEELYQSDIFTRERDFQSVANEEGAAASCGNFSYLLEEFGNELIQFMRIVDRYDSVTVLAPRSYRWLKFWQRPRQRKEEIKEFHKFQTPASHQAGWSLKLWRSLHAFRRPAVQFGIKVGLGAAIFAIPAFTDQLRPIFGRWRGEWGLVTYVIIMNKSVGGTANALGIRIMGTFLGALLGYVVWIIVGDNNVVLPIVGWLISVPCFWIILHWPSRNMFGRFILLTLNLTLMYTYSLSIADQDDGDEDDDETQLIVRDIAFHRFVSVCIGVLWALLVTTMILPNSARSKLKRGLSLVWLQMGLVWKSDVLETQPRKIGNEMRISGIPGEKAMAITMLELQDFLANAPNEVRLKGPFPAYEYTELLQATQKILDAFQDISVLVAKDPKASSEELTMIDRTASERRELCNRIFLNFYMLSSAMRLGFPVPDKMPSTEHAIDRMLVKLNEYRVNLLAEGKAGDDEDFVLFYSYILVTITITEQLAVMALHIQSLFGVIEDDMFVV